MHQSDSIRDTKQKESALRFISIKTFNPNHSDLEFIQTDSDLKFGLDQPEHVSIRFYLDWKLCLNSFGFQSRIELNWFSTDFHRKRFKIFHRFTRNDTDRFGDLFQIDSNSFGLNSFPKFTPEQLHVVEDKFNHKNFS